MDVGKNPLEVPLRPRLLPSRAHSSKARCKLSQGPESRPMPRYVRGTPQGARAAAQNVKPSIFDSFVESVKQVIPEAVQSDPLFGPTGIAAGAVSAGVNRSIPAGVNPATAKAVTQQSQQAVGNSLAEVRERTPLGLGPGPVALLAQATETGWSYGVARPLSTGALLANPESPLYRDGTVEQLAGVDAAGNPIVEVVPTESGPQLSDVQQAWNRSEDVSFAQAVVANPLITGYALATPELPGEAGKDIADITQYDPWSVSDMAESQDNPYYRFVTGTVDASLQLIVPSTLRLGRLKAMERLGLRTTVDDATLAAYQSDWERWKAGDTANNQWGQYITELANESNFSYVRRNPIVANSRGADKARLTAILQETTDPDTAHLIAMADRGHVPSLRALWEAAPNHVWSLSQINDELRSLFISDGVEYRPTGEQLTRANQVFDSAVARDNYFAEVQRLFTTEQGSLRYGSTWGPTRFNEQGGKVWDPLANWLSKKTSTVVEGTRRSLARGSVAVREADYERTPTWLHETMNSKIPGAPAVRFMHWVGSRQPLGMVSRSGARPDDLWQEFSANLDQVPIFASTKPIVVGRKLQRDGTYQDVYMTPAQYRQTLVQRVIDGQAAGGLQPAYQAVEDDIVRVMAYNMNVPEDVLLTIVAGYRSRMDETFTYMQNNSAYLYDDAATQIRLSPDSRRQMLDSFPSLPLGEIYKSLRGELSPVLRGAQAGTAGGQYLFDQGAKIFRTNVLFRFGYIPKNSIGEPWLASMLSHGTILTDEGLMATLGNIGNNASSRLRRVQYAADMRGRIRNAVQNRGIPRSERKQLAHEMTALVSQRTLVQRSIEEQVALLESLKAGEFGPTARLEFSDEIRGRLVDAKIELDNIEAALDGRLPEWRQVVEPATLPELQVRLRELRAVTGQDEAYLREMRQELDDIRQAVRERSEATSPRAQKQRLIDELQAQIDDVDSRLGFLAEQYAQPRSDVTGISVAQGGQIPQDRVVADALNPFVLHPRLPKADAKKIGLLSREWAERFVRDMDFSPEQQAAIQTLARKYIDNGMDEVVEIGWDPTSNRAQIDIGDGIVRLEAARAAGITAIPVKVVRRDAKDFPRRGAVPLPEGRWIRGRRPEQKTPRVLHPDDVFPDQYGIISRDRAAEAAPGATGSAIESRPTGFRDANQDPQDTARGRDLQAIALQRQREGLVARRDEEIGSLADMPAGGRGATANEAARMAYLETTLDTIAQRTESNVTPDVVERIQGLQNQFSEILEGYNTPAYNPAAQIDRLENELAAIERKIAGVQVQQGDVVSRAQSVSGIRAYKGSGDGYMTVYVGSERMRVPAAFSDREYDFGPGYRSEASAATTARQTFDPSYYAAHGQLRWDLLGQPKVVNPESPTYWDELEHVGNRYFRGDKLIQRILTAADGTERRVAAEWLATPEGVKYQKSMGRDYLRVQETRAPARPMANVDSQTQGPRGVGTVLMSSTTDLDDVIRLVRQYFPDPRVRQMLAAGELDSGTLQRLMGARDDLKPIVGEDLIYNPNRAARIGKGVNRALDRIWRFMSSDIEDRVARWPWYNREFNTQMQRRINTLSAQNVPMTADQLNALRQSAHRETLSELEKTFYNIRRYSKPVYQSRFFISFPGAFFNSLYRYGRFAAREPERVFLTSQIFGNMLETMGVDAEGNPVGKDLTKAEYLVIPGTKKSGDDTGVRVPVAAFNSLAVGAPGLSFLATYAVSKVVEKNPTAEEIIRNRLGDTMYDEIFPYGIPRDAASVFLGSYQKDILAAFSDVGAVDDAMKILGMNNDKFITTSVQVYADKMARWERDGYVGDAPTFEQAVDDTRAFILSTAGIKFVNPLSTNRPAPGQLMRDAWYEMRQEYGDDRIDEARQAYMEQYGDWARWYTYSSSKYQAYIPSTQDAYDRVFVDYASLTKRLVALNTDDPSLVSLMTIGTEGEFSESVSNYLRENPLPGDSIPIATKMNPEQFDNRVKVDDGWAWYNRNKPVYDAERARLVGLRDGATNQFDKDYYRQWIANTDATWKSTVKEYETGNIPWMLDRAPNANKSRNAAVYLTTILQDPKFAAGPGATETWQRIDQFLTDRQAALSQVAAASKTEEKQAVRSRFYEYVMNGPAAEDPSFAAMFNRYFAREWVDE